MFGVDAFFFSFNWNQVRRIKSMINGFCIKYKSARCIRVMSVAFPSERCFYVFQPVLYAQGDVQTSVERC